MADLFNCDACGKRSRTRHVVLRGQWQICDYRYHYTMPPGMVSEPEPDERDDTDG